MDTPKDALCVFFVHPTQIVGWKYDCLDRRADSQCLYSINTLFV